MLLRGGRRLSRRDRGAAAVEMALVMPVLLMIVCAIIDFGRMYNKQITLTQAAREGARAAAYSQTTTQVQQRVALATDNLAGITTTVDQSCGGSHDYAKVTVSYTFTFVTPLAVFVDSIPAFKTLTSTAVVTCSG